MNEKIDENRIKNVDRNAFRSVHVVLISHAEYVFVVEWWHGALDGVSRDVPWRQWKYQILTMIYNARMIREINKAQHQHFVDKIEFGFILGNCLN